MSKVRTVAADIENKLLRAFVGVATERSFTAAAQLIGCSQGAISTRVRALENQIGERLFHRSRLNVRLTSAGFELLPDARALLHLHDQLVHKARCRSVAGTVRIGIAEGFGALLLATLLDRVRQRYRAVRLEVLGDLGSNLHRMTEAGAIDLALAVLEKEVPSATTMGTPRLRWVAAPDFLFNKDEPIPVASYPEGCPVRASVLAALETGGVNYGLAFSTWSDRLLDHIVRSRLAITAMPESLVSEELKVLNRPSLLPRLDRVAIQLLKAPNLENHAASIIGRELVDIYRGL